MLGHSLLAAASSASASSAGDWEAYDGSHDGAWTQIFSGEGNAACQVTLNDARTRGLALGNSETGGHHPIVRSFGISGTTITPQDAFYSYDTGNGSADAAHFISDTEAWAGVFDSSSGDGDFSKLSLLTLSPSGITASYSSSIMPMGTGAYFIRNVSPSKAVFSSSTGTGANGSYYSSFRVISRSGTSLGAINTISKSNTWGYGCTFTSDKSVLVFTDCAVWPPTSATPFYIQIVDHSGASPSFVGSPQTISGTSTMAYSFWVSEPLDGYGVLPNRCLVEVSQYSGSYITSAKVFIISYDGTNLNASTPVDVPFPSSSQGPMIHYLGNGVGMIKWKPGTEFTPLYINGTNITVGTRKSIPTGGLSMAESHPWFYPINANKFVVISPISTQTDSIYLKIVSNGVV